MTATPILGTARAAIAYYTRYLAQDLGPFGIAANCIAPGVIATGGIMATVIPGSAQSNRDRAELVAVLAARNRRGWSQGRRVPRDQSIRLYDGGVVPIDGGLARG